MMSAAFLYGILRTGSMSGLPVLLQRIWYSFCACSMLVFCFSQNHRTILLKGVPRVLPAITAHITYSFQAVCLKGLTLREAQIERTRNRTFLVVAPPPLEYSSSQGPPGILTGFFKISFQNMVISTGFPQVGFTSLYSTSASFQCFLFCCFIVCS